MTQSPQVKDLGMSGGVRANLRVIGLVSPKNMTAVEALVSTQLIPKPDGGMDELRSIMAASPVGRAVFDGKIARWLPMPKLENHSGFDRDNRSLSDEVPEVQSPSQPIAPPPPESTRSRRGKITIPTRLSSSDARQKLEQAWEVADGEMVDEQPIDSGIEECYEIINGESDTTLRDALMMGFDWYLKEKVNGRELSKDTFINRAKTNRKSERLKEDRQSIWLEVQELISYYESL